MLILKCGGNKRKIFGGLKEVFESHLKLNLDLSALYQKHYLI